MAPSIRDRLADALLGNQKRQLTDAFRNLTEFYLAGPFEPPTSPEALRSMLAEYDSSLVQDLVNEIEWERMGGQTYDLLTGEQRRVRAVQESRRLWLYDVVTAFIVQLWTDFGFGENMKVSPEDEDAQVVWEEFWQADRNDAVLAQDNIQALSETLLVDGDILLAYYVSTIDGLVTVRPIDGLEITKVITDPDDAKRVLFYKRQWMVDGQVRTALYPDWQPWLQNAGDTPAEDPFAKVNALSDVKDVPRADKVSETTIVVMQHIAFKRRGGLRGWPLMTAGAPWSREHRRFRENRASVAAALAMYVQKIKTKGGSRAVDAIRAKLRSSLATPSSDALETNPPAPAGSTWLENEAATLEKLPTGTGAGDAKEDGGSLLMMAGLGGGIYPHWLGAGEAFRLATACYAEGTEILTRDGWKDHLDWDGKEAVACYNPETREQEFHVPVEMMVYDYKGEMVAITGRGTDALVTPNHRMLALNQNNQSKPWAKKDWEVQRADELPRRFALPTSAVDAGGQQRTTFTVPGYETSPAGIGLTRHIPDVTIEMDDWLLFLGWWVAEGWLERSGRNHTVGIGISSGAPEVDRVRGLIERLPFGFCEDKNHGQARWRATSKALHTWLSANCGSGCSNKKAPRFIFGLSIDQRRLFLDALWAGDGHTAHQEHYRGFLTTTSKQLADDVQQLILGLGEWGHLALSYKAGSKTSASVRTNRDCYVVHRNQIANRAYARGQNIREVQYEGKVTCFQVKTGFYITRRNGRLMIAGNTAMETPMHRQFSRYKLFWSAQFRRMLKIVLGMAQRYSGKAFETADAEVTSDRLVEVDLKMVSESVTQLVRDVLTPYFEAGQVDDQTTGKILASIWQIALQALGVENPDEVASDAGFGVEEQPQEAAVAEKRHPFGLADAKLRRRLREQENDWRRRLRTTGAGRLLRETGWRGMSEASSHQGDYGSGIRAAVRGLWAGVWSLADALDAMALAIEVGLHWAWIEGMEAAGIPRNDITLEEWDQQAGMVNGFLQYLPGFLAFVEQNNRASGGKLETVLARADIWINRYNEVLNAAKAAAATNPPTVWRYGPTKEHCKDCSTYVGRVHRAKTWERWGAMPQSGSLECGGWRCKCELQPTDKACWPGHPPRPSGG